MHLILELRSHMRGNQMPWKDLYGVPEMLFIINCRFAFLKHCDKTLLGTKTFAKAAMKF